MKINQLVHIDTNIFIYQFEDHPIFRTKAEKIFRRLQSNKLRAITSILTRTEILSLDVSETTIDSLRSLLLETPNLSIVNVNEDIAESAAMIRRRYAVRLPDAIQLATAVTNHAEMFITNDKRLKECKDINVQLLTALQI